MPFPVWLIGKYFLASVRESVLTGERLYGEAPLRRSVPAEAQGPASVNGVGRSVRPARPWAGGPQCIVGKNRLWGVRLPRFREPQAATGLPAPHFRRVLPQRGSGFTRRRLMGDTTKVNREMGGFDRAQTMSRFVRGMRAGNQENPFCNSRFVRSTAYIFLLAFPCFRDREQIYRRHRADCTETTNELGRKCEGIGTPVRTNRYARAKRSGRSAPVE